MERHLLHRELLDIPSPTRSQIEENLRNIALANRWLGGTSVIMRHLTRQIVRQTCRQPVRILDLATGGADIPIAVTEWAHRHGIAVQITAVDNDPAVVEIACSNTRHYPEICVDLQDIRTLPYPPRSFEFITCSQVIHHLDTADVITVLRSSCILVTQGIIVSDLHRRPICVMMGWLGSHVVSNQLSRHDALMSFRDAFTPDELNDLAEMAALPCWKVYRHGPCRLALVVDLSSAQCQEMISSACHAPAAG